MISISSPTTRALAAFLASAALTLPALGCGGGAVDASSVKHPLLGAAAPELGAEAVSGDGAKTLKDARGKVVILDFWNTFCEPCKKAFPRYQAIAERFPGAVTVIAVSTDEPDSTTKEQLIEFAAANHAKFAIVWDKDQSAVEKYGLRSLALPSSFLIDKAGVVRDLHVGFKDGDEATIAAEVQGLIGK